MKVGKTMKQKVWALHHDEPSYISGRYQLSIDSRKIWQAEGIVKFINAAGTEIVRYNDVYYLSFNRKALRAKAQEIKQQWIDKHQALLAEIEAIKI